ncbi:hypothetical protein A1F94_012011 [Pyrenophora tritici-repentis]|uniref:Uncharacterized protein n=1 Tax=Pyrenophora tritici-repentis TaxID=45151 RepID=A0A834S5H0_9PLEO|nr:hypothetical protein A1F99_001990 [Pyrenophora tritici-repentis]KAF7575985.1 hypothetical protein PtrM4_002250 [Pyrenophora tritici-repentis]KAG9377608.1 hypothetical protein A1F94_012011 [Pyrenophora tritici-repentis]KAI1519844.1 hypothetical protein Ptr86124_000212 [Pyrenophora tritici-repentis]KAI1675769.1 hypothetical protein L13192_02516 [Pyrenophora tritici-repentis]
MKVPTYFLILVVSTLTTAALPSSLDARSDLFAREDVKIDPPIPPNYPTHG